MQRRRSSPRGRPFLALWRGFGATALEARQPMPGDEILTSPIGQVTHACTIQAPPERIWPWLVQTGQGRAGFYSDARWWDACVDFYYRVLAREQGNTPERYTHRDDEVVADWQDLDVGSVIRDGPPGTAYYVVRAMTPQQLLVTFTDTHLPHLVPRPLRSTVHGEVTDVTMLVPVNSDSTRLVRRCRFTSEPGAFRLLTVPVVLLWGEALTARRFIRGIKQRAERPIDPPRPRTERPSR